ncbi:hypothetical protein PFISCL1PPCAC_27911 [Pristionchus fissidentatus]|uniref:SH3 domain-containing protein n=1 Tax=Pristionchus fissidentatus TaxID=1538716 RepID=A0AAV5X0T8_9BILA|nr:hypothetical protein PFISCL1PPCAC_27911 [Pristionchus fissidentatus]
MSLGKASGEKFAPAKSTIASVQNQLEKGFLPAVRHVAASANELYKAHQQLEKAAEAHAAAVKILAESTKTAQPGAKKHGIALERLTNDYEQLLKLHKGTMVKLSFLANKTTIYANGEKDKLKEMQQIHQKKEKDFLRAEKKKEKTEDELGQFYMSEAKSFSSQQEMRYKFFVDKHLEWFDSFVPMMKLAQTFIVIEEIEEKMDEIVEPVENHNHHHNEVAKEIIAEAIIKEELKEKMKHDIEEKINEAVVKAVEHEIHEHLHEKLHEAEVEESVPEFKEPALKEKNAYIENAHMRGVAVQVLPIAALAEARNLKPVEHDPIDRNPIQSPPPVVLHHVPPPFPVQQQHEYRPAMLPETPPVAAPAVIHHTQPVLIAAAAAPLVSPKPALKPVDSPVAVPVQFGASDYGKTLTVLQDYNASSGEQITVAQGDKVVLIKSGSRGWIFIRDSVSQRTGWIPSPFAAL